MLCKHLITHTYILRYNTDIHTSILICLQTQEMVPLIVSSEKHAHKNISAQLFFTEILSQLC